MSEHADMAVQRLAMSEASPLYKKMTEEEKAGYVKRAEGRRTHHILTSSGHVPSCFFHYLRCPEIRPSIKRLVNSKLVGTL